MLAFMVPELIIEELSIASAGINKVKNVDIWTVQSDPFQNDLKNIANKVNSNMEAGFKKELQKQVYLSFSLKYLPVQAMF